MNFTKRGMEQLEAKRNKAQQIALNAGSLQTCSICGGVFAGLRDIDSAYKLGNAEFSSGKLENIFEDRKEMTDAIQVVVQDHPAEKCPECQ